MDFPSYNFDNKVLLYEEEEVQVAKFLEKRGVGIVQSSGSCLTPPLCSAILPVPIGLNPQEDEPKTLNSRRVLRIVHFEQVDIQKRFLRYPNEFRASSCKQESRHIIFW